MLPLVLLSSFPSSIFLFLFRFPRPASPSAPARLKFSQVTQFEMDINIMAVDDAPVLNAPTELTTNENEISTPSSVFSASDIDAVEV